MLLLGLLGFVVVGLALGLLGGGGSILAVPVLVYILHLPASVAVPMSLPVVGVTAAFGAWRKHRAGQLQIRRAAVFGGAAMLTSFAAAKLGAGIPDRTRLLLFSVVLLVAALVGVLGLPMAEATATSLAVIALNSAAATAGWAGHVSLDVGLMLMAIGAALVGMLIGIWLAPRSTPKVLTRVFAILLVVVAVIMLSQELAR